MPNIAAPLGFTPLLHLTGAVDFPQNAFCGRDLVGAHNQQGVVHVKHGIAQQHAEQGIFLEKSGGKVLQVFDQTVVGLCPVHGEVKAVFVAPGGIGEVAGIRAVGDDKDLQIFEQGMLAVEALLAVTMHLIEGLADGHAAFFKLYLHQGQAVDQDGHVITVGVRPGLFKLVDDLYRVAGNVLFVKEANILDVAVVKNKVIDVIVMNLAGFVHKTVAGLVQPGFHKAFPLAIRKLHGVQDLQLRAHVGQQFFRRVEARSVLVALILQILNKLPLQVAFSLVAFNSLPVAYIRIENDEVVGFGYGLEVVHCNLVDIWPFEMCYPAAFFDLGKLNSMSR